MIHVAHFIAISRYVAVAALVAAPFAQLVRAPIHGDRPVLGAGMAALGARLIPFASAEGAVVLRGPDSSMVLAVFTATVVAWASGASTRRGIRFHSIRISR